MPRKSQNEEDLAQIDLVLNQLRPLLHIPQFKTLYEAELAKKEEMEKRGGTRTGSEPGETSAKEGSGSESDSGSDWSIPGFNDTIEDILAQPPAKFKADFRMSVEEMKENVFHPLAMNPVFNPDRAVDEGLAEYQIAVCVYRLVQPHSVTMEDSETNLVFAAVDRILEWIDRSLDVILSLRATSISWPLPPERILISQEIVSKRKVPECVGFLDGLHIRFQDGAKPTVPLPDWHPDNRLGLNVLGVADNEGQFRWVGIGDSSDPKAGDVSQQDKLPWNVEENERRWFDSRQMVVADKGFKCSERVVALYDIARGTFMERTDGEMMLARQRYWNSRASLLLKKTIQLAWGRLKGRFQYFREGTIPVGEREQSENMVVAAIILHNLLLKSVGEHVSMEEAEKLVETGYAERWARD
ncbi:hypothetical protein IAR50_004208 [Cryptococcus sp. DSM 104548]